MAREQSGPASLTAGHRGRRTILGAVPTWKLVDAHSCMHAAIGELDDATFAFVC